MKLDNLLSKTLQRSLYLGAFFAWLAVLSLDTFAQTSPVIVSTPGTSTFTVPAGVYSINVDAIGAGGGGGGRGSGTGATARGGGGGAFAGRTIAVTPGQVWTIEVGAGGSGGSGGDNAGANGGNTVFRLGSEVFVRAAGGSGGSGSDSGAGGLGGTVAASIGTSVFRGGNGTTGGGGGAGTTGAGGDTGGAAGGSGTAVGGGSGGSAPTAFGSSGSNGGNSFGGAGSGARRSTSGNIVGGTGAGGVLQISFVVLSSDLQVLKTVDQPNPFFGSNVTFTITATNAGPNNEPNASVVDLLPNGYTFVSATPSVGSYNSSTGVWTIGALNSSQSRTLQIVATVNSSGNYLNQATISGTNLETNNGNNTASVSVTPQSPSANDDLFSGIENEDVLGDVSVNDVFPTGAAFSVVSGPSNGSLTLNADGTFSYTPNNDFLGQDIFTYQVCLPAPNAGVCDSGQVTIRITGFYENLAQISASNQSDPNTANNFASVVAVPVPVANVGIEKTASTLSPN
ncbi:Ig-like domain-containing protein, partial [Mongoliitalea lutea]